MTNSKKRGFTIIELVIVIAVIAILAGVLIPTFVSVINKANVSSDTALVRNINEALAAEDVTDKPTTMYQALKVAREYGFSIEKLTPRSSGEIVWNSTSNRFALVQDNKVVYSANGEQIPNDASVWKIAHKAADLNDTYSNYLAYEASGEIAVTSGLDVGENKNVSVKYENTTGSKKTVVFNMNGGTLTVNAETDDVYRYGTADKVVIMAVAPTSYHECGTVYGDIVVTNGHVVLENGSTVGTVKISDSASKDGVKLSNNTSSAIIIFDADNKLSSDSTIGNNSIKVEDSDAVALIGAMTYKTLPEALAAAKDGDTVKLIADYTIPDSVQDVAGERINITAKITLNFGPYRLMAPTKMGDYLTNFAAIYVLADTTFVATGNGGIYTDGPYGVNVMSGAKLVIESGCYHGGGTTVQVQLGELNILGGEFSCEPYSDPNYGYKFMINAIDKAFNEGTAVIKISGGSFYKFDPANSKSESSKPSFVVEGYEVDCVNEWYTVVTK